MGIDSSRCTRDSGAPHGGAAGILLTGWSVRFPMADRRISGACTSGQIWLIAHWFRSVQYIWPDLAHCPWSNLLLLWPDVTLLQPRSTDDAVMGTLPHAAEEEFCTKLHRPESFRTILRRTIFLSSVKVAPGSRRRRESGWTP